MYIHIYIVTIAIQVIQVIPSNNSNNINLDFESVPVTTWARISRWIAFCTYWR